MEPNQGGIIQAQNGNWYFLTHHGTGGWEGRVASLLPVTWIDEWPIIGKVDSNNIGTMIYKGNVPGSNSQGNQLFTSDYFDEETISLQWQWNYQPRIEMFSLNERPGWLRLKAFKPIKKKSTPACREHSFSKNFQK